MRGRCSYLNISIRHKFNPSVGRKFCHSTKCLILYHFVLCTWCCFNNHFAAVFQWCGFKSRRGKNKNLTVLKSNSNTVWFNFQTYIYIYIHLYNIRTSLHLFISFYLVFISLFDKYLAFQSFNFEASEL
jgi:hypothetical protein